MWLDPENDLAVLVATNRGDKAAKHAVQASPSTLLLLAKQK